MIDDGCQKLLVIDLHTDPPLLIIRNHHEAVLVTSYEVILEMIGMVWNGGILPISDKGLLWHLDDYVLALLSASMRRYWT